VRVVNIGIQEDQTLQLEGICTHSNLLININTSYTKFYFLRQTVQLMNRVIQSSSNTGYFPCFKITFRFIAKQDTNILYKIHRNNAEKKIRPVAIMMFTAHFENLLRKCYIFFKITKIGPSFYPRSSHDHGGDIIRD
jgi:hypothetical protein